MDPNKDHAHAAGPSPSSAGGRRAHEAGPVLPPSTVMAEKPAMATQEGFDQFRHALKMYRPLPKLLTEEAFSASQVEEVEQDAQAEYTAALVAAADNIPKLLSFYEDTLGPRAKALQEEAASMNNQLDIIERLCTQLPATASNATLSFGDFDGPAAVAAAAAAATAAAAAATAAAALSSPVACPSTTATDAVIAAAPDAIVCGNCTSSSLQPPD